MDIKSMDIESMDIESMDNESIDNESMDIESMDISGQNSFDKLMKKMDQMNIMEFTPDHNTGHTHTHKIAHLLEKLTNQISCNKYFDNATNQYILNIIPPTWFYDIDEKYQDILMKLIKPVLELRLR